MNDDKLEELYQLAINQPLAHKIDLAVETFKLYESVAKGFDMFEPWFHLRNSFGKDSCVIDWLARRAGVAFRSYHSVTTMDSPELMRFGREFHPDTIRTLPKKGLLPLMVESGKGPPTRIVRWCCELYKENGCHGQIKVFGVRAEESHNRKQNWRIFQPLAKDRSYILNPILYWTDADIWELIRSENIPYCSIYDEGFKRLGCIGCPMAGKGRVKEFARWPRYEAAWKNAFAKFWEKWHGVPLQRERWVSLEVKYPFRALPGETHHEQWFEKRQRHEHGFWTYRRWYDLKGYETWEQLWNWWMEDEEQPEGCTMGSMA